MAERDVPVKMRREQEQRVEKMTDECLELMGLTGRYELEVIYDWGLDGDMAVDPEGNTMVHLTCCATLAQWQYSRARLRWFMPRVVTITDHRLRAVVVHEIIHIVLNPIDSLLKSGAQSETNNEKATEDMTRVVLAAAGIDYP